jgi:hypothetical protein
MASRFWLSPTVFAVMGAYSGKAAQEAKAVAALNQAPAARSSVRIEKR